MAKLRSFQLLKPTSYPSAVASAPVLTMNREQLTAAREKFLKEGQERIDAMWAKGSCSKTETMDFLTQMCPF
ncbi:MAG: hypothetical protein M0Q91_13410 [Methanoregula sp.]|jgi:hypothetical protein|nr:hypothetical protein [Methanoregula sp.]